MHNVEKLFFKKKHKKARENRNLIACQEYTKWHIQLIRYETVMNKICIKANQDQNLIPFHEYPLHANPEECRESDPAREHHTPPTYHPQIPSPEPTTSTGHQSIASSQGSYTPFPLTAFSPRQKNQSFYLPISFLPHQTTKKEHGISDRFHHPISRIELGSDYFRQ